MPLSNSRVASSIGGQHSTPRSVLGGVNTGAQFKLGDPLEKAQAGLRSASQTAGSMQQKGGSTSVTEVPGQEKTITGGLTAGIAGVTSGLALTGGAAGVATALAGTPAIAATATTAAVPAVAGGIGPALTAIGPVGWAIGALSLGAYLFS